MSKRKSKAAAPDMSGCAGCRHYFEAADPNCYRQSIPALRLHTGRGAQAALSRGRGLHGALAHAAGLQQLPQAAPRHHRGLHARAQPLREGRALRKLHYHLADPPELISACLRCKKPECTNCLERKLRTAPAQGRTGGRRAGAQSSTASPGRRK